MLQSLLPKAHMKFRVLPLVGPIADGFEDWLTANGYTPGSREFSIRFLPHVAADLRKRGVREIGELNRAILYDSWCRLIKVFPEQAGTVRTLARYLNAVGMITTGAIEKAPLVSPAAALSNEYAAYLADVRGCARSTINHHTLVARCFVEYLQKAAVNLDSLQPSDIERYITQTGKRLCRASLQHEVAAVR